MEATTTTLTGARCATQVTNKRTDELSLGELILVPGWCAKNGAKVELGTVTGLTLLNDTVELNTTVGGEITCKVGTVWQVVEAKG